MTCCRGARFRFSRHCAGNSLDLNIFSFEFRTDLLIPFDQKPTKEPEEPDEPDEFAFHHTPVASNKLLANRAKIAAKLKSQAVAQAQSASSFSGSVVQTDVELDRDFFRRESSTVSTDSTNPFGDSDKPEPNPPVITDSNPFGDDNDDADDSNPFGDDKNDVGDPNPFGNDEEEEKQNHLSNPFGDESESTNPFGDDGDDDAPANPFGEEDAGIGCNH